MRHALVGSMVFAAVLLTGCGQSEPSIEARIARSLETNDGIIVDGVVCPEPPSTATTTTCTARGDFARYIADHLGLQTSIDTLQIRITVDASGQPQAAIDQDQLVQAILSAAPN